MSGEQCCSPRKWYTKEWDPRFSTLRNPPKEDNFVECRRKPDIDPNGKAISIFLSEIEDSVPYCKVQELEKLCREANEEDLKKSVGAAGMERIAWLDDRTSAHDTIGGCVREYQNPLTATALYQSLKKPVRSEMTLISPNEDLQADLRKNSDSMIAI
jgi:hypothetical protein